MTKAHAGTSRARAFEALERDLKAEARRFVESRARHEPPAEALPSMLALLGCGPTQPGADLSDPDVTRPLAARLRKALRQERSRSRSGHAGYDFGRHLALHEMLGHLSRICPAMRVGQPHKVAGPR
jgi:hypothetical protein